MTHLPHKSTDSLQQKSSRAFGKFLSILVLTLGMVLMRTLFPWESLEDIQGPYAQRKRAVMQLVGTLVQRKNVVFPRYCSELLFGSFFRITTL